MNVAKLVKKLSRQVADKAYRLERGKRYRAHGTVMLCPLHTDDFLTTAEVGRMQPVEAPEFEVMEIRPRRCDGLPWYLVRLVDGRAGWFNGVGLVGRNVVVVK